MNVTIGLAFLAGLASFLSPCVFSLVPAYIGYLGGRSAACSQMENQANRWDIFTHGVAFVLGFSLVFVTLGVAASALGGLLSDIRPWIGRIGGVIVIIFGIHMTGILRIPFLEYDLRPQNKADRQRSYFSSAFMGIAFSAGWSPCIGPVLGAIATMAMLLNVDLFVLGGSVAKSGEVLLERTRRAVFRHAYRSVGCGVQVIATELGDDGPILGCAWIARQALAESRQTAVRSGSSRLIASERANLEQVEGMVFDVQRFSVHDGPGIRTNVFMKGCPMAIPAWAMNTQVKLEANNPLSSPKTPVSMAPIPTPVRNPRVSITHEAGTETTIKTSMKIMESMPKLRSETW